MSAEPTTPHPQSPAPEPPPGARPLLSLHAFTVLLGAAVIGAIAAGLAYAQDHSTADAAIAGGGLFLVAVPGLHHLIG
ncbi:hypothetical protein G5C51_04460 [Streptomyces sp. A7024]|uniref:Uncharacterized protein n=1 Tax=Streptomyces coryli TaxID=1128680 RepID=A0A6G4TUD6_9ACTN|nr:hypothetical protein [Streptomyces coryli]NGN63160.1 hypothetical protein [Streptomyces coryli]